MPDTIAILSRLADETVNVAAVAAIAVMVLYGDPSYEPIAAITSIALGKAYMGRNA